MNDNQSAATSSSPEIADAHGRAALLLVESLIHGLCERAVLGPSDAVEIADRAEDVASMKVTEAEFAHPAMRQAHTLLASITTSLRAETIGRGGPLHLV